MFKEIVQCIHCNSENVSLREAKSVSLENMTFAHYHCNAPKCHKDFTFIFYVKRGIK